MSKFSRFLGNFFDYRIWLKKSLGVEKMDKKKLSKTHYPSKLIFKARNPIVAKNKYMERYNKYGNKNPRAFKDFGVDGTFSKDDIIENLKTGELFLYNGEYFIIL